MLLLTLRFNWFNCMDHFLDSAVRCPNVLPDLPNFNPSFGRFSNPKPIAQRRRHSILNFNPVPPTLQDRYVRLSQQRKDLQTVLSPLRQFPLELVGELLKASLPAGAAAPCHIELTRRERVHFAVLLSTCRLRRRAAYSTPALFVRQAAKLASSCKRPTLAPRACDNSIGNDPPCKSLEDFGRSLGPLRESRRCDHCTLSDSSLHSHGPMLASRLSDLLAADAAASQF
ncbi:hypothetical protein CC2G_009587 [Coprinopsis cinerea AmutBmut pab1-1]|nr:hypothetical protein CC2G_009587 [Coprinopsis cinerea AmutBmut pab1-1]